MKGCDGDEEEEVGAVAALPHEVAPVGAPSVYCCGGERSSGAPSAYSCGGAEERKGCDGDAAAKFSNAVAPAGAPSAAAAGLYGECGSYS
jgi:hypothetical protein